MERRELLAAAGVAGVVGTAGCLGYDVVDDGTVERLRVENGDLRARLSERTDRVERLEARVAELEARVAAREARVRAVRERLDAPTINAVHLVDGWDAVGDVVRRRTDVVDSRERSVARLAVNFSYPPEQGTFGSRDWWNGEATVDVAIRGVGGDGGAGSYDAARAGRERTMRVFTEPDQRLVETEVTIDLDELTPGAREAVVTVTDARTALTSEPRLTTFRIR